MEWLKERKKMVVLTIVLAVIASSLYIGLLSAMPTNEKVPITNGYRANLLKDGRYIGKANLNQKIWVTISLKWSHGDELNKFLGVVNNPESSMYHHYLSYDVFKKNFAPSERIYNELVQWLKNNDVHIAYTYNLRNAITIYDTIGKISKLLGVNFGLYRGNGNHIKSVFFAATSAPKVPAKFVPYILGFSGLDNATKFHLNYYHSSRTGRDYLTGADVARMYHVYELYNDSANGAASSKHIFATGLRVATVLWDGDAAPFDPDAITYYYHHVIPQWIQDMDVMSTVHWHGMSGAHEPGSDTDGSVSGENELDLEMVGTLAPGVDAYCVYGPGSSQGSPAENNFPDNEYNYILNTLAKDDTKTLTAVSNSWGDGDSAGSAATDNAVKALNAMGVTVLASSGDDGDTDSPSYPSTDAHDIFGFVAVGGTTPFPNGDDLTSLTDAATMGYNTNLANPRIKEVVWYDSSSTNSQGDHWGTQSGISQSYGWIEWQKNYIGKYDGRVTADISAMGNHTLVYLSSGGSTNWGAIAGTSVACPVVAGMIAEMDAYIGVQYHISNHGLGFLLPTIYKLGYDYYHNGMYSNSPPFYDVTQTPAGYHNGETQYWAKEGWDPASGWGVINAWEFVHDISFTMSTSTPRKSISTGGAAAYYINVKFPYTWNAEVGHFELTGLPTGATYSTSTSYVHPTGNGATAGFTLTVQSGSTVANGNYTLTLEAYVYNHTNRHYGNLTNTLTLYLSITSNSGGTNGTSSMKGIDVSHWQGDIDWTKVYNAGYRFAFVKATEGTTYDDPKFSENINNGYTAGVMMGAYHFAHPDKNSAVAEADHFVNVIKPYLGKMQLPPALDLETGSSMGWHAMSNWVNEFMNEVKSKTGLTPIIYVNVNYALHLDSSVSQWPLWIADWTYNPNATPRTGVWSDWDYWQYSDKGTVPGISGSNVDIDIYKGATSSVPSAPLNLHAIAGDGYVKLTWEAPSNTGGSSIVEYKIYRGTSSGGETFLAEVSGSTLSYNDTSVTNGVTYYYYVVPVNSAGAGDQSNEVSATPGTAVPELSSFIWIVLVILVAVVLFRRKYIS